jgi:hypothetical protein
VTEAALKGHDKHPVVPHFGKSKSDEACSEMFENSADFATFESGEKCAIHAAENGKYWTTFLPSSGECLGFDKLSIDEECSLNSTDSLVETWRVHFPMVYHYGADAGLPKEPEAAVEETQEAEEA